MQEISSCLIEIHRNKYCFKWGLTKRVPVFGKIVGDDEWCFKRNGYFCGTIQKPMTKNNDEKDQFILPDGGGMAVAHVNDNTSSMQPCGEQGDDESGQCRTGACH